MYNVILVKDIHLMLLEPFYIVIFDLDPLFISRRALAQEGDYEMMPVCACVRALVSHADSSKTTTATDFL